MCVFGSGEFAREAPKRSATQRAISLSSAEGEGFLGVFAWRSEALFSDLILAEVRGLEVPTSVTRARGPRFRWPAVAARVSTRACKSVGAGSRSS